MTARIGNNVLMEKPFGLGSKRERVLRAMFGSFVRFSVFLLALVSRAFVIIC